MTTRGKYNKMFEYHEGRRKGYDRGVIDGYLKAKYEMIIHLKGLKP